VRTLFGSKLSGATHTALNELRANFHDSGAQGAIAYASQMLVDHPDEDSSTLIADAVLAVSEFHQALFPEE
jgi:hypothetical protein